MDVCLLFDLRFQNFRILTDYYSSSIILFDLEVIITSVAWDSTMRIHRVSKDLSMISVLISVLIIRDTRINYGLRNFR